MITNNTIHEYLHYSTWLPTLKYKWLFRVQYMITYTKYIITHTKYIITYNTVHDY